VAVEIVDRLEVIEIDDEQRADFIFEKVVGPLREFFEEAATVGKSGQHIVAGQPMGLEFSLSAAGHLPSQIDEATRGVDNSNQPQAEAERE
jgi:hypothetical protein